MPNQPDGQERTAIYQSNYSKSIGISTVFELSKSIFNSVKSVIEVSVGSTKALHQVMVVHNSDGVCMNQLPFLSASGTIANTSIEEYDNILGIGTFGVNFDSSNNFLLKFYPDAFFNSSDIQVSALNLCIYNDNDVLNTINTPDLSYGNVVESVDLSLKINLKKIKGAENSLRTLIDLPHGNGKKLKVAVLCDENKLSEAKKSGADVVGSEDLLKKISDKDINFDKLISTPSMMAKIGKLGKILGPKGLMPNPKMGTVSDDLIKSVDKVKNKSIEIKNDKDGNLAFSIGRKSFPESKLLENLKSVFQTLKKEKSSIFNGENIKKIYLSSSMGPSFKLNFKDI